MLYATIKIFIFFILVISIAAYLLPYSLSVDCLISSVARSLKFRHVDLVQYLDGWPPEKTGRKELGSVRRC